MRFTIVSETYPPEVNGVALTVHALERGLRNRGHQVGVVRPRQPPTATDASVASRSVQDPLGMQAVGDKQVRVANSDLTTQAGQHLLVRSVPLPRYPGLRIGLPSGGALLRLWREQRPDAIYVATEGPLGWSALRTAQRLGIPATTGFHTRFDEYMQRYGVGLLTPLAFAWMRRFHNGADSTLVPTEELADYLRARGFRNVQVLRRAVDTRMFDPARRDIELRRSWGLADDALAVSYMGRIAAEKNLDLAVHAFRALQRMQPDARFVWIGDGPTRAAIAAANPDFVFTGVQRGEELARHFASTDMFVFPSTTETFGNVTLEAMASAIPTVAFDYGAARQHLRDGEHGAAVPIGDQQAFIDAVLRVAGNATARRAMGLAARRAVSALDPDSVAACFDDILTSVSRPRCAA